MLAALWNETFSYVKKNLNCPEILKFHIRSEGQYLLADILGQINDGAKQGMK